MSNEITPIQTSVDRWETAIVDGNLDRLQPAERLELVRRICASTGLTMETQPFQYLRLSGKLVLYARRDATDQLRRVHKVSIVITNRETVGDVYIVTARATMPDGRTDESTGAVAIKSLVGDALANATMKAETKAKRRVTLSICGLGMLDESEVETIPGTQSFHQLESKPALATPEQFAKIKSLHASAGLDAGYWDLVKETFKIASARNLTAEQAASVIEDLELAQPRKES